MNLIQNRKIEYNENLLRDNYTLDNNEQTWFNSVGGGTTVTVESDINFIANKVLKVSHNSYDINPLMFRPTIPDKFSFTIARDGDYTFSFEALLSGLGGNFPELTGNVTFIRNGNPLTTIVLDFSIGNNTEPLFTFAYNKWQTFSERIQMIIGDIITIEFNIDNNISSPFGIFELYLKEFKLEYAQDRDFNIPTYYTKPIYNNSYRELDGDGILDLEDKIINTINGGETTITLPTAVGNKGKRYEFFNSEEGLPTIVASGVELIGNSNTYLIPPETGINIESNDIGWIIISKYKKENFNRTQFLTNIVTTSVPNATALNIFTLIPNLSKVINGTDGGINELNIIADKIVTEWRGTAMTHEIRLLYHVDVGTIQTYNMELRRFSDDSVLAVAQINRNVDTSIATANFTTYTNSAIDPFVTDGFYIAFNNTSGTSADLITKLNLLITTYFR